MIIEEGFYNNATFHWDLVPGTSGQMHVVIDFFGTIKKFNKLSDKTIMNAFGFQIDSGEEAPSHFMWHRGTENGKFCISWTFMFETMPINMQKWQYLNHIFKGIDQVNKAVRNLK